MRVEYAPASYSTAGYNPSGQYMGCHQELCECVQKGSNRSGCGRSGHSDTGGMWRVNTVSTENIVMRRYKFEKSDKNRRSEGCETENDLTEYGLVCVIVVSK